MAAAAAGGASHGAALLTVVAAMAVVITLGSAFYRERVHEIETAVDDGRKLRAEGRFPEAVHTLSPRPGATQALSRLSTT